VPIAGPSVCRHREVETMLPGDHPARSLLSGSLLAGEFAWPLLLHAVLCDLRPRFISKGQVAGSYRAVSRNGRVLLASRLPLAELPGRNLQVRLQTWHKLILPGEPPQPWGILLCLQPHPEPAAEPVHVARLLPSGDPSLDMALEVGGGLNLTFVRWTAAAGARES
jgi:hypothetical protein